MDKITQLHSRGVEAFQNRQYKLAKECFEKLLKHLPEHIGILNLQSIVLTELKQFDAAERLFKKILKHDQSSEKTFTNYAALFLKQKKYTDALPLLDRAISLNPSSAIALSSKAEAFRGLERFEQALVAYNAAIDVAPVFFDPWLGKGLVLIKMKRAAEAEVAFRKALELDPASSVALARLAGSVLDQGRVSESIDLFNQAILLDPNQTEAFIYRGAALHRKGSFQKAMNDFDQALALDRNNAEAYLNKSLCHLIQGDFPAGFENFDRFRKIRPHDVQVRLKRPPLPSLDHVPGKRILVHWEQGLGDTIQFCRYLKGLDERGAEILFAPQPVLSRLLQTLASSVPFKFVNLDEKHPAYDYHVSLMLLPKLFGTQVSTIPVGVPYLSAEPMLIDQWHKQIGDADFKIGICWQGSKGYMGDSERSFPVTLFEPIGCQPNVRLISLCKGEGEAQLQSLPPHFRIETLGDDFDSGPDAFVDSAAVIKNLDLIITSDTSIAHLSGALGAPTWLAIPYIADWRWLTGGAQTPWYPNMRLFRQESAGDWGTVFQRIKHALNEHLAGRLQG